MFTTSDHDIQAPAPATGVLTGSPLRYEPPINTCALCGMPTSGVLCLSCATK